VKNTKEGLEKVATNPGHVIFMESSEAEYIVSRDCRQVKRLIFLGFFPHGLKKNFGYS
jgi:hypothetical protein